MRNLDLNAALKNFVDSNKPLYINGLSGGSKGLFLSLLAARFTGRTIIAIVPDEDAAGRLADDTLFFMSPGQRGRLAMYPSTGALPFSRISPEPEIWADRLQILCRLLNHEPLIIIAPADAVLRRTAPVEFIADGSRILKPGGDVAVDELSAYLVSSGYEDVGLVENEGTFAKRGGIFDIWSPTSDSPMRIELDGERILSMRKFDPVSQLSTKGADDEMRLDLIPVREIPFDQASRDRAAHRVRDRGESPLTSGERRALIEAIHEGVPFSGIDTLLGLFHEKTATFFDFLPRDAVIAICDEIDVDSAIDIHHGSLAELHAESKSPERIVNVAEIIISAAEFDSSVKRFACVHIGASAEKMGDGAPSVTADMASNADIRPMIVGHGKDEDMLAPLVRLLGEWRKEEWHVILTCHTEIQAERLGDLFHIHGVDLIDFDSPFDTLHDLTSSFVLMRLGRLSGGFRWADERLAIITDEEIFGEKISRKPSAARPMEPFSSLTEISENDYIVHEQHGIGRYKGLSHLVLEDKPGDYMLLEYLGGDKLYLPIYRLNLVGKYIGSGDAPPALDKLGGIRWSNLKAKVRQEIGALAKELLETFAERKLHSGFAFADGGTEFEEFCAAFPYDETPDQAHAIDDVMRDMSDARPADRLICGDVGYGKTEVAMRAAYRAATSGRQVAVLVPTTVLALQHFETFTKRFAGTPITIGMLSRFRSTALRKRLLEDVRRGTVDIVVGTHRLLQKDVQFKNLGLLIVDEEHRFGVRHKERIKKLRTTIDVLAMTATPIPRTLNLALVGIRDISVINTPPADRLSITTYVVPFDEGVIRQAILKEIARGGQVFFVHNRVETIQSTCDALKGIIPEARIEVGHGQLPVSELERVMINFLERRSDVLLCTAIIESGLDIPNANTIIINRADMFGLAQLYQLRGRVGRSSARAYAYLLTPREGKITRYAEKRLAVLKRYTALGSGFQIAMHDLEFRGAGNILGSAQSGHINAVGYELYTKLLDRTMRMLKGMAVDEEVDPELSLKVAAFLPEDYVEDQGTRIELYRRLAGRESEDEIEALCVEMTDRFGPLPPEALNLLRLMEVRLIAKGLKIRQITFDGAKFSLLFDPSTPVKTGALVDLARGEPTRYRLIPDRFIIVADDASDDTRVLRSAKNSLSSLISCVSHQGHAKD